jgi:soluble lytic murein transglycosylase-like protein
VLAWLLPAAQAADPPGDADARLRNWAPTRKDLDQYLPIVQGVLHRASDDTLVKKPVAAPYSAIFRPLVLATAWKETCWRQFTRRAGKIMTMQSGAGAVGIMQVNPRVWRGFYDVNGLKTDTVYNARAGAEILQHYLVDYAIRKKEHELGGGIDALARATYSAYNGGPGHLNRYRSAKNAKSLRQIDEDFWRFYQTVKGGNELGVRECFVR